MSEEIKRRFILDREPDMDDLFDDLREPGDSRYIMYAKDQFTAYLHTGSVQMYVRRKTSVGGHDNKRITDKHYIVVADLDEATATAVNEMETEITAEQYEKIIELVGKEPIHTKHLQFSLKGYVINTTTVDPASDTHFTVAEVSFASEEEAEAFVWPFKKVLCINITNSKSIDMWNNMPMHEYWEKYRLSNGESA